MKKEIKQKISNSLKGRKKSNLHRHKISESVRESIRKKKENDQSR